MNLTLFLSRPAEPIAVGHSPFDPDSVLLVLKKYFWLSFSVILTWLQVVLGFHYSVIVANFSLSPGQAQPAELLNK